MRPQLLTERKFRRTSRSIDQSEVDQQRIESSINIGYELRTDVYMETQLYAGRCMLDAINQHASMLGLLKLILRLCVRTDLV